MEINDVWSEVFVRVDPTNIFTCMLISKQCLQVITAPGFRRMYQKRWDLIHPNPPIVGFIIHGAPPNNVVSMSLKATSIFMMNANLLLEDNVETRFVSKSDTGDILYGVLPNSLYVMSPTADKNPVELPKQDSWSWKHYAPAILSSHDSYKVILIRQSDFSIKIRTFCPSLGKWKSSDHKSERNLSIGLLPGIVNNVRGLVYWPRCDVAGGSLAVYDDNNEQQPVSWIPGIYNGISCTIKQNYGLSPNSCGFRCLAIFSISCHSSKSHSNSKTDFGYSNIIVTYPI